ncbi:MAG: methylated-DNA--[protein]-cysteine S-methyltransferase [Sporolactobacillus sp.]
MQDSVKIHETETIIGSLTLAMVDDQLCYLAFGSWPDVRDIFCRWAHRMHLPPAHVHDDAAFINVDRQLGEFLNGERAHFELSLLILGTDFQKKVWNELTRIPYGQTRSYKEIAESIGHSKAVRAVGNANNKNPLPLVLPCHRVIGTNGSLTGYGGGVELKRQLLDLEKRMAVQA